jgi:hypothetical protein
MRAEMARRQRRGALLAGGAHVLSQCMRSASLFIGSDLLFRSAVPLPVFACAMLATSAAVLSTAFRPPLRLLGQHAAPILWNGLASAVSTCLWGYGLARCGPLRTLLFDHSELPLLYFLPAFGRRRRAAIPRLGGSGRRRGALVLLLAYALLLGTHGMHRRHTVGRRGGVAFHASAPVSAPGTISRSDTSISAPASVSDRPAFIPDRGRFPETNLFDSSLSLPGFISGELALLFAGLLNAVQSAASRRLASQIGRNRLQSLIYGCGALLCAPAAALACVLTGPAVFARPVATAPTALGLLSMAILWRLLTVAIFGRILPAQAAAAASAWLTPRNSAVGGMAAAVLAAAVLDTARGANIGAASATPQLVGCAGMVLYGVWAMHDGARTEWDRGHPK